MFILTTKTSVLWLQLPMVQPLVRHPTKARVKGCKEQTSQPSRLACFQGLTELQHNLCQHSKRQDLCWISTSHLYILLQSSSVLRRSSFSISITNLPVLGMTTIETFHWKGIGFHLIMNAVYFFHLVLHGNMISICNFKCMPVQRDLVQDCTFQDSDTVLAVYWDWCVGNQPCRCSCPFTICPYAQPCAATFGCKTHICLRSKNSSLRRDNYI